MNRFLVYMSFIMLLFFSNSCVIYQWKANKIYKNNIKNQPFDAVIVPGIPYNGKQWDDVMKMRVLWAVYLYKEGITKHIIFSGSAVYSHFIESEIMRQYAIALGVDANDIMVETCAEHSTENVYYSYVIARNQAWTNVALATDLVQTQMVKKFINNRQLPVSFLPVKINIIKDMATPDSIYIDTLIAFVPNFRSIVDTQTHQYRWRGTQGKNIDFRKYRK